MIDQTRYILQHAAPGTLESVFKIVYGKPLQVSPIQAATLFMRALNETQFFAYTDFLRSLKHA